MAANNKYENNSIDVKGMIAKNKQSKSLSSITEKLIPVVLFLFAIITVFTTVGIVFTLLSETIEFFKRVPIWDFFTGTVLKPMSQNPEFGVLPLLNGTIISSAIAMLVAGPIGLMAAIYLSEYASDRVRRVLKPMLEILAG